MVNRKDKWNAGVFLSLGSNRGNLKKNLDFAIAGIENEIGSIKNKSSIYETEPWGNEDLNRFVNQVVELKTALNPEEVLQKCLEIENKCGRKEKISDVYENRILDIDVLFYGNCCCKTPTLILPHPEIEKRNFVLEPLAEIAANFIHPQLHRSIKQLLDVSADDKEVKKVNNC